MRMQTTAAIAGVIFLFYKDKIYDIWNMLNNQNFLFIGRQIFTHVDYSCTVLQLYTN